MSASFDVAVIVVGLNASRYVRECFQSLADADWHSYSHEVIYVDNGSTDDTLAMLAEQFPSVQVLQVVGPEFINGLESSERNDDRRV